LGVGLGVVVEASKFKSDGIETGERSRSRDEPGG
jgi:hypothetical protein